MEKYKQILEDALQDINMVIWTHEEHATPEEYRRRLKRLFCHQCKNMVDVNLNKDES